MGTSATNHNTRNGHLYLPTLVCPTALLQWTSKKIPILPMLLAFHSFRHLFRRWMNFSLYSLLCSTATILKTHISPSSLQYVHPSSPCLDISVTGKQLFHILHDPTFHAQYARFVDDPSSAPVSWLAILFILLSLAVNTLEDNDQVLRDLARGPDAPSNICLLSRRYREAAMKCLARQGVFWGKHNIQSLQALILLVYAMGHSQDPTWVLLGESYSL